MDAPTFFYVAIDSRHGAQERLLLDRLGKIYRDRSQHFCRDCGEDILTLPPVPGTLMIQCPECTTLNDRGAAYTFRAIDWAATRGIDGQYMRLFNVQLLTPPHRKGFADKAAQAFIKAQELVAEYGARLLTREELAAIEERDRVEQRERLLAGMNDRERGIYLAFEVFAAQHGLRESQMRFLRGFRSLAMRGISLAEADCLQAGFARIGDIRKVLGGLLPEALLFQNAQAAA